MKSILCCLFLSLSVASISSVSASPPAELPTIKEKQVAYLVVGDCPIVFTLHAYEPGALLTLQDLALAEMHALQADSFAFKKLYADIELAESYSLRDVPILTDPVALLRYQYQHKSLSNYWPGYTRVV